jgi:hypothetical protein
VSLTVSVQHKVVKRKDQSHWIVRYKVFFPPPSYIVKKGPGSLYVLMLCTCIMATFSIVLFFPWLVNTFNTYNIDLDQGKQSMFCGPEIVNVSRGEPEVSIGSWATTKHTVSQKSQSISILLYAECQRKQNEKKRKTSIILLYNSPVLLFTGE